MSYIINKFNGQPLLTLQDGILDSTTSIGLLGRNYIGYGEVQNENFLHLMENFAGSSPPSRPIEGQAWFDTEKNLFHVYDGNKWSLVGSPVLSQTAPESPSQGALWLKTPYNTLYVYDNTNWVLIGPETSEGFGITRARSTVLISSDQSLKPVILITVDDQVIGIVSKETFTLGTTNLIAGFSNLTSGFNISTAHSFSGFLNGAADRANRLATGRSINGVVFDGSTDITLKSSTLRPLRPGNFLIGNSFDGGSEQEWYVDATSSNIIGKVVARDSAGDFSAGTITANLIGDVQGNVNVASGTSSFNIITANRFIGASLSGNSFSATKLEIARNINGVEFDGTSDITISASAATLTGNSLNSTVLFSNLIEVGTLTGLSVENSGISIGSQLQLSVEDNIAVVKNPSNNQQLTLAINDAGISKGIRFIPSSVSLSAGGENLPAAIPTVNSGVNLGHQSFVYNKIFANNFVGALTGTADLANNSLKSNNLSGGVAGSVSYQVSANNTAFIPPGVPGQVLKSTGSGAPVWGAVSFAELNIGDYLTGSNYDGFVNTTISVDATPNNTANKVVARDASGNFTAGTVTANLIGNVTGNSSTATRLATARTINGVSFDGTSNITVTAIDSTKIAKTGDSMSGFLTLSADPTSALHAATKQYVDSRIPVYTFTSGQVSCVGFTNQVGSFNNGSNYFDVFPPSGKTISNLVAFIPSLNVVHYAGGVNGDDSIRTQYSILSNRIRVYVQNTEQRSTPAGNYLAVWS